MERTYCHLCGTKLTKRTEEQWKCEGCGQSIYGNPKPATGIVFIDKNNKAVLCVRGREPFIGKLDFIGGFLDVGETIEEALYREIREETGLEQGDYDKPHYVTSFSAQYPFGNEVYTNVITVFAARLLSGKIKASDDVGSIELVGLDDFKAADFSRSPQYDILVSILKQYQ